MIEYKGKTSLKQYMPMKPIKRGIKMWCRADSLYDKAAIKRMKRGDVVWRMKGPVLALTWFDKQAVHATGT